MALRWRVLEHLRTGDKVRLTAIGALTLLGCLTVIGGAFIATGTRLTWLLPLCLQLAALTLWATVTCFGLTHIECLAAHYTHSLRLSVFT